MWAAHCWWFFTDKGDFSCPAYPYFGLVSTTVGDGLTFSGRFCWGFFSRGEYLYVNL